ncbi:MAG: hypothetical protein KDC67_14225, partial [Ignavibacteriae bacterium]|nr:hypothetical protein [Ignavibacteriota bacterium]
DSTLDINVHDTYFVIANFHFILLLGVLVFFGIYLIRTLRRNFKNLTANLILMISTILLVIILNGISAIVENFIQQTSGWTIYPPLSAGEVIEQKIETKENNFEILSSVLFYTQILLLIFLAFCGFKTGLNYKKKKKNMLVFPIKDKKEDIVGVLQLLNSANGEFSDQEKMFLNAISLNVSFALENASLVEQLLKTERGNSMGKMGNFIAHDLKKPILVSKRYAEHLQKKDLPMDVKQVINLMLEQLTQVANQVAATADYTEGTTILRRQAVSLNDTLRDFALEIHSFVKTKNCKIEYSLSDDVNVYLDKKEFYQCYFNIVKNACEALPEGGNVFVVTEKNEDRIEISFEDRGIGIENSDLKHVFEPLWTKNKLNNSGLGLSISQKIIEDHEGSITIKSEKNEGTNVIISLPIH